MNRPEEGEGNRPQSRMRSTFQTLFKGLTNLRHRMGCRRRTQSRNHDTNSTPIATTTAVISTPSTASPSRSSTATRPFLSRPSPARRSLSSTTPTPGPPEHHQLSCSLRELYTGSVRVLPNTRTTLHPDGTTTTTSHRDFKVRIVPGWTHGTIITFHNGGSILHPGQPASDVVFTVEERPHRTFLREGNDLVMRKKVTLVEALTGCRFLVSTLDGRRLSVDVDGVIPVGFEMGIMGEGMPVLGDETGRKGKLRVKLEIEFPKELSVEQKEGLKRLFDGTDDDGAAATTGTKI